MGIQTKPDIDYLSLSQEKQLQSQVQPPQVKARPVSIMRRTFTKIVFPEATVRSSLSSLSSGQQTADKLSSSFLVHRRLGSREVVWNSV